MVWRPCSSGVTAVALLFAAAGATCIAHAQIKPGEYVFEQGRGTLRIVPAGADTLNFKLSTVGGNFHICELEGVIRNGEARMAESDQKNLPCIVTFRAQPNGIAVASKHERTCSTYCGMRAQFDGFYTLPPASCAPSEVRRTRDQFKAAYDRKQYPAALALLKPVMDQCGSLLNEFDDGWVRNDLAITYFRVGNSAACRDTLRGLVDLARQPDRAISDGYPPSEGAEYLRIAQATRYNMKLCGAPIPIGNKP